MTQSVLELKNIKRWFGEGEKDSKTLECIKTWQKHLPDYQIKEWSNKDLALVNNQYVTEAFQSKKWISTGDKR